MKSKIITSLSTIILVSFSSSSCSNNHIFGCATTTTNPSMPIKDLLAYPDNVVIEGNKFKLQVSLISDHTLTVPIPTSPCLRGNINIISDNNVKLSSSYKVGKLWIINGKNIWETNMLNSSFLQDSIKIEGGPDWLGNGLSAVLEITDSQKKSFFIKADNLNISLIG